VFALRLKIVASLSHLPIDAALTSRSVANCTCDISNLCLKARNLSPVNVDLLFTFTSGDFRAAAAGDGTNAGAFFAVSAAAVTGVLDFVLEAFAGSVTIAGDGVLAAFFSRAVAPAAPGLMPPFLLRLLLLLVLIVVSVFVDGSSKVIVFIALVAASAEVSSISIPKRSSTESSAIRLRRALLSERFSTAEPASI